MFFLYNFTIFSVFVLFLPYFLFRLLTEKKHRTGLSQRFGFFPRRTIAARTGRPVVWVHSVSVGEVLAAAPLIAEIRHQFPDHQLLLSTTTVTGHQVCLKRVALAGDLVIYFPVDALFVVRRVISLFSPRAIVLMEAEVWPNLIREATTRGIKLLLTNGRLSDRSFERYRKVRPFVRSLLRSFSFIGMQTEEGRERVLKLGAPAPVVCVMGSMKYEAALAIIPSEGELRRLREELAIPEKRVIVAGSTHRGEEQLVAQAYVELEAKYPDLFLLIAPRHPERFREVQGWLGEKGVRCRLRSEGRSGDRATRVMILDTLGELAGFYALASLAFVGKSFTRKGGHNPLEPAACGKPVAFGRHMENFREVADILLAEGGAIEVGSFRELVSAFDRLLGDEAAAKEMGRRAMKSVESRTGGVARTISQLRAILGTKARTVHDEKSVSKRRRRRPRRGA